MFRPLVTFLTVRWWHPRRGKGPPPRHGIDERWRRCCRLSLHSLPPPHFNRCPPRRSRQAYLPSHDAAQTRDAVSAETLRLNEPHE